MSVWNQLIDEIEKFIADVSKSPVLPRVSPSDIRAELESRYDFKNGEGNRDGACKYVINVIE